MAFPQIRMRRLRATGAIRRLVGQTALTVNDFIYPLFVREGRGLKQPIKSMTDCFHFSPDTPPKKTQPVQRPGPKPELSSAP
jgi:porphobilinogen synthase